MIIIMKVYFACRYEYSHAKDRLWRKTRSNHKNFNCIGVDPNRNWGYNWAGQGASGDPCDETFYGPSAFSEPETQAIRNFIMDRKDSMKVSCHPTLPYPHTPLFFLLSNRGQDTFYIYYITSTFRMWVDSDY